jgi:hypothetical protein
LLHFAPDQDALTIIIQGASASCYDVARKHGVNKNSEFPMGFIKTIFGLLILAVIVVFGYWIYASYVTAPEAPYWAEINTYMPKPMRQWSCAQTKARAGGQQATPPTSCEGYW